MKGTTHSTTAKRRIFKFQNANQVEKFIQLYSDLFVPYCDSSIEYLYKGDEKYNCHKRIGHYEDGWYIELNDMLVFCKMEGEDFNKVIESGLFEKERLRRNTFIYVYKG